MECNVRGLTLNYDKPEHFYIFVCQSQYSPRLFKLLLAIRILIFIYTTALIIWGLSLITLQPGLKMFIWFHLWLQYLWSFSAVAATSGLFTVRTAMATDAEIDFLVSFRVYWALFSAVLPSGVLAFISYWSLVFDGDVVPLFFVMNVVTPFLIVCEFAMVSFPLRILHFYYFMIFYILYIIFTVIYHSCGGTGLDDKVPIYTFLDWSSPGTAILTAFVGLVIGEAIYIVFCFISLWKLRSKDAH